MRSKNCERRLLALSCLSVCACLSARPSARNNTVPTRRIFMKFHVWILFENLSRKFKFHSNLTRITDTLHGDQYTFMIISRSVLLRTKNVVKKIDLQSVSDRVDLSVYIVKVFYTTVEPMKGAHPWPVYCPVHKSGCCEKKNTHHAQKVSSSNVGEKLIKMASYPATAYQRSAATFCSAVWTQSAATKQRDTANRRYLHVTCETQHILPQTSNS